MPNNMHYRIHRDGDMSNSQYQSIIRTISVGVFTLIELLVVHRYYSHPIVDVAAQPCRGRRMLGNGLHA